MQKNVVWDKNELKYNSVLNAINLGVDYEKYNQIALT